MSTPKQVAWCQPCGATFGKQRDFKKHIKTCVKRAEHMKRTKAREWSGNYEGE